MTRDMFRATGRAVFLLLLSPGLCLAQGLPELVAEMLRDLLDKR